MQEMTPSPRTDALDVIVGLLSELDDGPRSSGSDFYDPLCEALCRLTSMERAALMLYDDARKLVVPAGSHGLETGLFSQVHGTIEETPIAQRALAANNITELDQHLAGPSIKRQLNQLCLAAKAAD